MFIPDTHTRSVCPTFPTHLQVYYQSVACGWLNYAGKSHTDSHQVFIMVIEGVLPKNFGEYRATILQNYLRQSCHSCGTKRSFLRNKQREGDIFCISCLSLLSCACLEWVDKAEEWLIPAFCLIRSNFWQAVMWNHCRITDTPENWREIIGGWLYETLLFQQRPLRKNRPLGHHICVVTVYLVECIH